MCLSSMPKVTTFSTSTPKMPSLKTSIFNFNYQPRKYKTMKKLSKPIESIRHLMPFPSQKFLKSSAYKKENLKRIVRYSFNSRIE